MSDELKCCPFCGSYNVKVNMNYQEYVLCVDCKAMGPYISRVFYTSWEKRKQKAIEAWNRRAGEE